jgi:hypothetical protein
MHSKKQAIFLYHENVRPVVGSSKINNTLPNPFPFPKKEASFTRCASPPESVLNSVPVLHSPILHHCNGCNFLTMAAASLFLI